MKALTIQQPYAHLIVLPDDDERAKRVENRTWGSSYFGTLAIHAGKGSEYLSGDNYGIPLREMAFGAVVGVCEMRGCFEFTGWRNAGFRRMPDWAPRKWPWLAGHRHVEGPFCFVLAEVRRFHEPIPAKGAQRMWDWTPPENWESLLEPTP